MKTAYIHEREIWLIDLEPTKGIEMKKVRPCVVLKKFSKHHFVVLPLTTNNNSENTFQLKNIAFLQKESFVKISQIRTVDRSRFQHRIGKLTPFVFAQIKNMTAKVFQLLPPKPYGHNEHGKPALNEED